MDMSPVVARLQGNQRFSGKHYCVGLQGELFIAADLLAGIALIYLSGLAIDCLRPGQDMVGIPLIRDLILCSVIGALMLREPRLSHPRQLSAVAVQDVMTWRVGAALVALLSVVLALHMQGGGASPLIWLALFGFWVAMSRGIFVLYLRHLVAHPDPRETVAVVGAAPAIDRIALQVAAEADIVALYELADLSDTEPSDDDIISDDLSEMAVLAKAGEIDTVVVALEAGDRIDLAALVNRLKALPVQVAVCPEADPVQAEKAALRTMFGLPMTVVAERQAQRWRRLAKALFDRLGAAIMLALLLPVFALIAMAIVSDSPGPIIFRQQRNGWAGTVFTLYKFRTMVEGAAAGQTRRNDPRCTGVGAFLRRTSLDELPQLWNVLIGDMSLVGPRPHADGLHARERASRELVGEYAQRQLVKPGMTGWAQVHGLRGSVFSAERLRARIEFDLFYIDHWSLLLDLQILAMTPLAVLRAENAF